MSAATEADRLPRLDELQRRLVERGLAAAVTCSYETLHYFAGTHILTQLHLPDRLVIDL